MLLMFLKSAVFIFETFNNLFTIFSTSLDNTRSRAPSSHLHSPGVLRYSSTQPHTPMNTHALLLYLPPNSCLVLAHMPKLSLCNTPHPSWSPPEAGSIMHKPKVRVHLQIVCKLYADCFLICLFLTNFYRAHAAEQA